MTLERGEVVEETDLTKDEVEQLVVKLGEVIDVLHRREEGELIAMVGAMVERLLSGDTREIASDVRHAIPRLHELWCGRIHHNDVAADDSASDDGSIEALVHGTPSRCLCGVDFHHFLSDFCMRQTLVTWRVWLQSHTC